MHFMLQNEVVERMVAEPSTPEYGRLSVMLQYRFRMEKLVESLRIVPSRAQGGSGHRAHDSPPG